MYERSVSGLKKLRQTFKFHRLKQTYILKLKLWHRHWNICHFLYHLFIHWYLRCVLCVFIIRVPSIIIQPIVCLCVNVCVVCLCVCVGADFAARSKGSEYGNCQGVSPMYSVLEGSSSPTAHYSLAGESMSHRNSSQSLLVSKLLLQ